MVAEACAQTGPAASTMARAASDRTLPCRRAFIEDLRVNENDWECELIDGLSGGLAPCEAISRSLQGDHSEPMVGRVAPRRARNHDDVTGLQRVAPDTSVAKLAGASPFDVVDR